MKYGIQLVHDNGSTTYAYSAKGGYIYETDDITNIALFVQKDSAIKALKAGRKLGYEPEGTTLQVVGISLVVSEVTDVEKPPQKVGHVLVGLDKDDEEVFYGDPRAKAVDRPSWVNAERATFFKSDIEARTKLQEIREYHIAAVEKLTVAHAALVMRYDAQEAMNAKYPHRGRQWDSISKWQVEQANESIVRQQKLLDDLDHVTIEFVH